MSLPTLLFGPLAAPECRRAAHRGRVVIQRTLAGLLLAVPATVAFWWLWMRSELEPSFRGGEVVPQALGATTAIATAIALLLSPAVLAGSLAGERERGAIGLLLSTRVDAREIVLGRLLGKLTPIFAMLLAGWPFLILFGMLGDLGPGGTLALLALPFAVALGTGGLAVGASSVAKRGWSALMTVYLAEVLLAMGPMLGLVPGLGALNAVLGPLNPTAAIAPTIASGSARPMLGTLATWAGLGLLGSAFAAWRLRPTFLASVGGKARGTTRRHALPPVDEARPMLWKERNIDRGAVLGRAGRFLGSALILYLTVGSLLAAGFAAEAIFGEHDPARLDRIVSLMDALFARPSTLVSILIQLAIGLRAAVGVASERERGTWDALLTSPLTGREIVGGKLQGSLHSLRWLALAAVLSWSICLAFGAMTWREFAVLLAQTILGGTFAAAVGVRASLACATATRAMSVTVAAWLATLAGFSLLAAIITFGLALMALMAWMVAGPLGLVAPGTRPWFPTGLFPLTWTIMMAALYTKMTLLIVGESWARFDGISGRIAGDGRQAPITPPPGFDAERPDGRERMPASEGRGEPVGVA